MVKLKITHLWYLMIIEGYIKEYKNYYFPIIKNVSSSTSHKKTPSYRLYVFPSFRLSLREFKKILPNIFIYYSIFIKIYMNANIMISKIFDLCNDLWRSQKVTYMFSFTWTYVLMDNFFNCILFTTAYPMKNPFKDF